MKIMIQIADLKDAVEIMSIAKHHVTDCDSHGLLVRAIWYLEREIEALSNTASICFFHTT